MAYDGHIVCKKCRRALYLGKYKEGRFWPGKIDHEQFATGVTLFIEEHFAHGDVVVMGDGPYERYLDSCPSNEWPVTVFVEATDDDRVKLVEQPSVTRG
jgi:hypothetical protein